jgi:hypothetical protein
MAIKVLNHWAHLSSRESVINGAKKFSNVVDKCSDCDSAFISMHRLKEHARKSHGHDCNGQVGKLLSSSSLSLTAWQSKLESLYQLEVSSIILSADLKCHQN